MIDLSKENKCLCCGGCGKVEGITVLDIALSENEVFELYNRSQKN